MRSGIGNSASDPIFVSSSGAGAQPSASSQSVTPASDAAFPVVGNSAASTADSGNPVKVGGVFNTTQPALTTGQRGDVQLSAVSTVLSSIADPATAGRVASVLNSFGNSDATSATVTGLAVGNYAKVFNGTTWDRARGDVTAAFTKPPPRAKSQSGVTAGSTASQQLFAANATRSKLIVQNQDASINVFVNLNGAATAGAGSLRIAPGATLELTGTNEAVNLIAASGTPAITAWEF